MLAAVRSRNAAARFPGRVALVVGGTAGIGRAVALRLAEAQYRVFVVGRDEARGAEVVAECSAASGPLGEAHEFIRCDASLLSACRATAADVAARVPALDALVLSQGIASMAGFTPTAEGIDVKLALHYFGRVAFVQALLPLLRAAPSPRVLAVLSAGVHGTYAHSVDDFELRQRFSIKNAADAAGCYTDAAWDSLSREAGNERVTFVHAAPGFVATSWGTELPFLMRGLTRVAQRFATPAGDAAEFLADPLFRESTAGGFLLQGATGLPAAPVAQHAATREAIWAATREVLARVK
jgi:NAD(P)-dependent dehydrogenase (short-subunit alcohol dehydrogenase family)